MAALTSSTVMVLSEGQSGAGFPNRDPGHRQLMLTRCRPISRRSAPHSLGTPFAGHPIRWVPHSLGTPFAGHPIRWVPHSLGTPFAGHPIRWVPHSLGTPFAGYPIRWAPHSLGTPLEWNLAGFGFPWRTLSTDSGCSLGTPAGLCPQTANTRRIPHRYPQRLWVSPSPPSRSPQTA